MRSRRCAANEPASDNEFRRWQQRCAREDQALDEDQVKQLQAWEQLLDVIPRQLKQLRKSQQKRSSRTDPEGRYLRRRGGFCLGYTGELAMSDDHIVVARRVHQKPVDNRSLHEMTKLVQRQSRKKPPLVVADCGYHSMPQIHTVERNGIEVYVADQVLAGGPVVEMNARQKQRTPGLAEHRERMRGPTAREHQRRRKAIVEPVFGVLKQQRGCAVFAGVGWQRWKWNARWRRQRITSLGCGPTPKPARP